MLLQGRLCHALANFKAPRGFTLALWDGFVNVGGHDAEDLGQAIAEGKQKSQPLGLMMHQQKKRPAEAGRLSRGQ